MKYRVLKRGDRYYPQYKLLFGYVNMTDYKSFVFEGKPCLHFDTEKEALEYIKKDIIKEKEYKGKVVAKINSKNEKGDLK